jgi:hypothetical protein
MQDDDFISVLKIRLARGRCRELSDFSRSSSVSPFL